MDEDTRGAPKKRSKITQQLDKPRYALDDAEGAERADAETVGERGGTDIERGSDTSRARS